MRATILPLTIILHDQGSVMAKAGGQGEYCDLSAAFEVFRIFTTQLYIYSCLCNCNAKVFTF